MKKLATIFTMALAVSAFAQQTANRFFYELTFKPKKSQETRDKVLTALDIVKEKSVYQDFTVPAQDSIIKAEVEAMEKTGMYKDMSKSIKMPKFSYKVVKTYPSMDISVEDGISTKTFSYKDPATFNWQISPEKSKMGTYDVQKATTDFGGRHWTAWFTTALPFQDGPYKFYGLPGLIVKIEDDGKEYSWMLKGNEKVENWTGQSYAEGLRGKMGMNQKPVEITKDKFDKAYANFKADPLAEMRPYMTPEMMGRTMPGSSKTIGEFVKEQEQIAKDFFGANDNPIEKDLKK